MDYLSSNSSFPPVEQADEDGLLAIGGDLSDALLLEAYHRGIFPWYDDSQPILWWSPDPRMVLFPEKLKISKSMRQLLKNHAFRVTYNENFPEVIKACSEVERRGQDGTWITEGMQQAYINLHRKGFAHSVEVWQEDQLVGGLYGIYLRDKKLFCGESMFSKVSNASKYGFIKWVEKLKEEGVRVIDCQVHTAHMESLGAEEIPREEFLKYL